MKRRPVAGQGRRVPPRGFHRPVNDASDPGIGRNARAGFSLIEVIVATAILMGSVVVLARLAGMGRTMAQKTQLHSDAQRVCEQTLNEILLGLRPLEPVERAELTSANMIDKSADTNLQEQVADDRISVRQTSGRWLHSVRLQPHTQIPSLQTLTVVVEPADDKSQRPLRFRLSRFVRRPSDEVSAQTMMEDAP